MNVLIHDGTIVPMHDCQPIRQGAIAIEGNDIVDIGQAHVLKRKYSRGYERIDAKNKIIIPGLINTHQHAAMSLLRGYADDLPLKEWLEKWIWPIERHMTPQDIYVGAKLTAIESIMSGTTTVNTMYHYKQEKNEAKALADTGLRGVVGHVCFSWRKKQDLAALQNLAKAWHGKADGLIRISVDPHSPYTVDPEYMRELREIRAKLDEKYGSAKKPIITHTHVAETADECKKVQEAFNIKIQGGIVRYLNSLGVLDKHVIAAHCVALTSKDMQAMKERSVKVSHNPVSNLKLASGISPVPEMLSRGITVSLGTDSPCSNNTADMFDVVKTAAILHKGANGNPTLMPAEQVLAMATIEGAKALSWDQEIGSLEAGKKADLVILDAKKPHLCPMYNEASHLVYAAKGSDVETVMINGNIVMENRELVAVKAEEVMEAAEKARTRLLGRLDANVK